MQIEYSPCTLDIESPDPPRNILATCRELGVAIVAYSPLGRGFLTGQLKSYADIVNDWRVHMPRFSEENFDKNLALAHEIQIIADQKHVTPSQLVLAWLMQQYEMLIPIPGTRSTDKVTENLGAAKVHLTAEENEAIRKIAVEADVGGSRYPEFMMAPLFGETPELK